MLVWQEITMSTMTAYSEKPHAREYRAYLLRCWREEGKWFLSLEEVSGERRRYGFSSLEAMIAFLQEEMGTRPPLSRKTQAAREWETDALSTTIPQTIPCLP